MKLIENTPAAGAPRDSSVEVRNLAKRYGRRWALADVSFTLPSASVLLIIGHNGSGKSTMLRLLSTATSPSEGSARIAGHALEDVTSVRRDVALLSHHSYLYDTLTAASNLELTARFLRDVSREEIDAALNDVGLFERRDDVVSGFSAGMRKRVAIARVLLQRPSVILLDEPYGSLDPQGFVFIDRLVTRAAERGATVLMATHHIERSALLADYAMVLSQGRVEWSGAASDALRHVDRTQLMAEVRA